MGRGGLSDGGQPYDGTSPDGGGLNAEPLGNGTYRVHWFAADTSLSATDGSERIGVERSRFNLPLQTPEEGKSSGDSRSTGSASEAAVSAQSAQG